MILKYGCRHGRRSGPSSGRGEFAWGCPAMPVIGRVIVVAVGVGAADSPLAFALGIAGAGRRLVLFRVVHLLLLGVAIVAILLFVAGGRVVPGAFARLRVGRGARLRLIDIRAGLHAVVKLKRVASLLQLVVPSVAVALA